MSRFALHPRWLPYLPPTMAPVATSARDDVLEHPEDAFTAYRSAGVTKVICEEKHMGSRAVVLVCRDAATARARFGAPEGESGAIYTRTGRSFFSPDLTEQLLGDLRKAATTAGLWDELGTGWVLLDCELLPWSAKAKELLPEQYAAVGAAARAVMPVAVQGLKAAAAAGVDVAELLQRTTARASNAEAFTEAYRRYCWPVDGLNGLSLAPFQVLASEGATYHERDHGWHLSIADRLVEAAPDLVRTTRRLVVDTEVPDSVSDGITWWEDMTESGGEGMVVKPFANLTRTKRGLAQPGIKARGRENLRIIYGPDYTEPRHLDRLRDRKPRTQALTRAPRIRARSGSTREVRRRRAAVARPRSSLRRTRPRVRTG